MKRLRIPLYISFAIMAVGLIVGSFFDYRISEAVAGPLNGFGLVVTIISPTIGLGGLCLMSGGCVALAVKFRYKLIGKIGLYILATLLTAIAVLLAGSEYFGVNGLNKPELDWIGYLIVLLPFAAAEVGGYFIFKNNENEKFRIVLVVASAALLVFLAIGVMALKEIMHRPRFRTVSVTDVPFYNWWTPCSDYKAYMQAFSIASEEFKSFPSGHTAYAGVLLMPICIIPLGYKRAEKLQLPLYIAGLCFVILVEVTRVLVSAHYLSDVSFGALLTVLALIVTNEVCIKIYK